MQCSCGYSFVHARLAALQRDEPAPFKSYMVVDDADYKTYRRAENRAAAARGKAAKSSAVANVARYTGSMSECPECGRFVLVTPEKQDDASSVVLTVEKSKQS